MVGKKLREWLGRVGATTIYLAPGSHWKNGHYE
jgi:hypothetical protein